MKLIILSGRSGSGKTTALRILEDEGFNCIDNFPVGLLQALVENARTTSSGERLAVCIDARNEPSELRRFPELLLAIDRFEDLDCQVIYLDARNPVLVRRFSETRRRHPLTDATTDLRAAIETEGTVLEEISDLADLTIDTTQMATTELGELIRSRVIEKTEAGISLLFLSFGFKSGVPVDADFVFDIRCLPNPHWVEELRPLTGKDKPVQDYLEAEADVIEMFEEIRSFLETWLPRFERNNRIYLTVAIGCTGGQHRSVFMAEKLAEHFSTTKTNVLIRHREGSIA